MLILVNRSYTENRKKKMLVARKPERSRSCFSRYIKTRKILTLAITGVILLLVAAVGIVKNLAIKDSFAETQYTLYFYDTVAEQVYHTETCTLPSIGSACNMFLGWMDVMLRVPEHEGYKFLGFSDTLNGDLRTDLDIIMHGDKTLYARYNSVPVSRTLSFDANGGSGAPTAQSCIVNAGSSCNVTIPNVTPVRDGYTFAGWSDLSSASVTWYHSGYTMVLSSNKKVYAIWKDNNTQCLLTFYDTLDMRIYSANILNKGTDGKCWMVDYASPRLHDGYRYIGVSLTIDGGIVYDQNCNNWNIDVDTIYYLQFEKVKTYSLSFDAEGGYNVPETQTCTPGPRYDYCDVTIPDTVPIRDNYDFLGWGSSVAVSATYHSGDTVRLLYDTKLYAVWGQCAFTFYDTIDNGVYRTYIGNRDSEGVCRVTTDRIDAYHSGYEYIGASLTIGGSIEKDAENTYWSATTDTTYYLQFRALPNYSLSFNANGGRGVPGSLTCTIESPGDYGCDVIIPDDEPSYSRHTFIGYAESNTATSATYQVGDTVTLSSDMTLYAVWEKRSPDSGDHGDIDGCNGKATNIEDAICLQDMNNIIKFTMVTNEEYELIDARDGTMYRIAKLKDGNVWLLDNLHIGGNEEMVLRFVDTNTNPDINNGEFILPSSGDWVDSYTEPAIDIADASVMLGNDADKPQGGYYNYCAASAGTYCDEEDEGEGDAEFDICPAGWRMPTGGFGGEYQVVNSQYSNLISILHLPLSGRFYRGSSGQIDENGYFWSSTNFDGTKMYYLHRDNQMINAFNGYKRDRGYSMRCVAKDIKPEISCNVGAKNISEAVCLQDINAMAIASMENEQTYVLFDGRDFEPYRIAKLADDNVWLLDNLKLGGEEEMLLTSKDTNTNPDINNGEFILPASGDWVDSYTEPAIDVAGAHRMLGSNGDKTAGGYYNYCAASAGTYCDEENEGEGDAEFDICPAGWRMPTGGDSGEYQSISLLYDDLINTLFLPLSGRFYGGSSNQIDQVGYFWSSTSYSGARMHYLNRSDQSIDAVKSYYRDRGYSMRCVVNIIEDGTGDFRWKDDVNERTIGDDVDLTFIVDLPLRALTSVKVDGEELNGNNYSLEDGSTIINFDNEYTNSLPAGTYELTVSYISGATITSEFIINEKEDNNEEEDDDLVVPDTGLNTKKDDVGVYIKFGLQLSLITTLVVLGIRLVWRLKKLKRWKKF